MFNAFLFSGIARWVVLAFVAAAGVGGLYLKGRIDGNAACIAKQNKQMARMEAYIKTVRDRIERNLPLDDDILRTDPFEREP